MKNLLASLAALAALTTAASAADLPRRAAPPAVFTPIPVFTWTGFYAGFNAGYGFDSTQSRSDIRYSYSGAPNAVFPTGLGLVNVNDRGRAEGFVGGGQIGYNYQFTPGSGVVIGVEADAQYADFNRTRATFANASPGGLNPPGSGSNFYYPNSTRGLEFFGTARGRLGYAFDNMMFYGTGGFAYGSAGQDLSNAEVDKFQTGYTVGAGVEYALPTDSFLNFFRASAVTLKVEGLYVNLGRNSRDNAVVASNGSTVVRANDPALAVFDANGNLVSGRSLARDTEFATVRAGINYKFGSY